MGLGFMLGTASICGCGSSAPRTSRSATAPSASITNGSASAPASHPGTSAGTSSPVPTAGDAQHAVDGFHGRPCSGQLRSQGLHDDEPVALGERRRCQSLRGEALHSVKGAVGSPPTVVGVSGNSVMFSNGTTATLSLGAGSSMAQGNERRTKARRPEHRRSVLASCSQMATRMPEATFSTTTPPAPPQQVFVTFIDVTAGAPSPPARRRTRMATRRLPAGSVLTSGDRITCQIQKVINLEHGGSTVSGAGPVVNQGPIPTNYGIGNGNTPW